MNDHLIPEEIRELASQRAQKFRRIRYITQPREIQSGQIWSTLSSCKLPDGRIVETEEPRLIVVLHGNGVPSGALEEITAAPVSLLTSMATDFDLIIPVDLSPLGFEFMVEVWNETPTLIKSLRRFLGSLPYEAVVALQSVYRAHRLDQEIPNSFKHWVGFHLTGKEDQRRFFQEQEVKAIEYLATASTAALGLKEDASERAEASAIFEPFWKFRLEPVFKKLSEVFHAGPRVAYAQGPVEEGTTCLFICDAGEQQRFAFELLNNRRRPPYKVYLKVHMLSDKFLDHRCVVVLDTQDKKWRSAPTKLERDSEIVVGEDPHFRHERIRAIEVEIEE